MNVQKSSGRGKGRATKCIYPSTSRFGSLWFLSWASMTTEKSEGRAPQTAKQAAKSCSPDYCGITLNFHLFAEKRAVLLGLGDQLLAQQQIFNVLSKSLVNLSFLLSSHNSKAGELLTYLQNIFKILNFLRQSILKMWHWASGAWSVFCAILSPSLWPEIFAGSQVYWRSFFHVVHWITFFMGAEGEKRDGYYLILIAIIFFS